MQPAVTSVTETAHPATVVDTYRLVLGRDPTGEEMHAASAAMDLAAELSDSLEYRARFRDAAYTDTNARSSVALWPAQKRPYDLHIVIISGEHWPKCRPTIEALLPGLTDRTCLTVLCGEPESTPFPYAAPGRVELIEFSGQSVYQLWARLPGVLKEAMWVGALEDHAVPKPGWVEGVLETITTVGDDIFTITGGVANDTTPWSWANFLFNFAWHWSPSAADSLPGTVATTLFRRDLVGIRPFALFRYEEIILGRRGQVSRRFAVNHIQHTNLWQASTHVFDNGRVAGSALRRNSPSPRRATWNMVSYVCTRRLGEIATVLRAHPRFGELPAGTLGRIRWISLCHSAGVLLGVVIGGGGAHKRLE